jgi:hypothetical protein
MQYVICLRKGKLLFLYSYTFAADFPFKVQVAIRNA